MMATTHAYVGIFFAVLSLPVAGEYATAPHLLAAAFVGGLLPDADLVTNHRKTLHFPVYLPVVAVALFGLFVSLAYAPSFLLIVAFGVASAGLHSLTDILAGGVGHEPWKGNSSRSVYNHFLGRWHTPGRLVRYSGAPEDFVLCAVFAIPTVLAPATGPTADGVLVVVLVASGLYTLTRRRLSDVSETLTSVFPDSFVRALPSVRFEEE